MVRSLVRVLALAAALVAPGASGLHGAPRVHRTPAATTTPAFVNGASATQLRRQRVAPSLPGAGCTKTSTTVMSAVDPNNVIDVISQVAVAQTSTWIADIELYVPPNPFQVPRVAHRPTSIPTHATTTAATTTITTMTATTTATMR